MGRDSLLEFHAPPLGCVHAWGVARARLARVILRNNPFRTIPDSLCSPRGFEMRVARPHRRFSTVENRVTCIRANICRCDWIPKVSIQPAPSHNRPPFSCRSRTESGLERGLGRRSSGCYLLEVANGGGGGHCPVTWSRRVARSGRGRRAPMALSFPMSLVGGDVDNSTVPGGSVMPRS